MDSELERNTKLLCATDGCEGQLRGGECWLDTDTSFCYCTECRDEIEYQNPDKEPLLLRRYLKLKDIPSVVSAVHLTIYLLKTLHWPSSMIKINKASNHFVSIRVVDGDKFFSIGTGLQYLGDDLIDALSEASALLSLLSLEEFNRIWTSFLATQDIEAIANGIHSKGIKHPEAENYTVQDISVADLMLKVPVALRPCIKQFPPLCRVISEREMLRIPRKGSVGRVVGYGFGDDGSVLISVVHEDVLLAHGVPISGECKPEWLQVIEYDGNKTPEWVARILAGEDIPSVNPLAHGEISGPSPEDWA